MDRKKILEDESYSVGNLDESTIAYFLKHLDTFNTSKKVKHKLKIVLIELISNILSHSQNKYGSVFIKRVQNHFIINASNFTATERIIKTIELLNNIKQTKNLRQHYLNLLSEASLENMVSLGLVEIFRLSDGEIKISTSTLDGKSVINFEIKLNDGN